jgi:hypothetical protein
MRSSAMRFCAAASRGLNTLGLGISTLALSERRWASVPEFSPLMKLACSPAKALSSFSTNFRSSFAADVRLRRSSSRISSSFPASALHSIKSTRRRVRFAETSGRSLPVTAAHVLHDKGATRPLGRFAGPAIPFCRAPEASPQEQADPRAVPSLPLWASLSLPPCDTFIRAPSQALR